MVCLVGAIFFPPLSFPSTKVRDKFLSSGQPIKKIQFYPSSLRFSLSRLLSPNSSQDWNDSFCCSAITSFRISIKFSNH
ncbi:hypothetical protein P8452_65683 [Trifolium repens]|nr:hypothetical protein P8452_65683 [Trifolium repens]